MNCTLKVNMILADGRFVPRGEVIDIEELPAHLRTSDNIVKGVVTINKVMPIDMVEISDDIDEVSSDEVASPMQELTLDQVQPVVHKPKKLLRRR